MEELIENYQSGYIKVFRSLKGHWIWNEGRVKSKFEAWMYLLLEAQWSADKRAVGYDLVELERGQLLSSQEKLSIEWGWNRGSVRSFLTMLERDGMISQDVTTKYTKITICKYDSYQGTQPTKDQQTDGDSTSTQHRSDTNNKVNNTKKVKKEYSTSQIEKFEKFSSWLIENAEEVSKMKVPFNPKSYEACVSFFVKEFNGIEKLGKDAMTELLKSMHNRVDLHKKNRDANLTIRKWHKMEKERSTRFSKEDKPATLSLPK